MAERYKRKPLPSGLKPRKKGGVPGPGRPKGVPNKLNRTLKMAIEGALDTLGEMRPVWSAYRDGKPAPGAVITRFKPTGRNGVLGYMCYLGQYEPALFTGLVAKILPHTLNVNAEVNATVTSRFQSVDVNNKSLPELMSMYREAVGLTQPLTIDAKALPNTVPMLPPASMIQTEPELLPAQADAQVPGTQKTAADSSQVEASVSGSLPIALKKREAA